jgi:phospho-N-acetylmuramoyl-pentapeptide-transferase
MYVELVVEWIEYFLISFLFAIIIAPILIRLMYKYGQVSILKETKQGLSSNSNSLFMQIMDRTKTNGTPNMGGILILLTVPLVSFSFLNISSGIRILLYGFILFGLWGLVDVAFTNATRENKKLKSLQESFGWRIGKLLIAICLNILITYLMYESGVLKSILLWKGMLIVLTPMLIPIIALVSQLGIYASEITDGEDALMIGIMGIIYTAFAILLGIKGHFEYIPFIAIVLGTITVDLYFNIPPARFWNGGPGAMPLGYAIFYISIITDNILPYFVITSITWLILTSSVIQIVSLKFFRKKVFRISPIHHHFKAIGWPSYKIVMRFWLFTLLASVLGILIGLTV